MGESSREMRFGVASPPGSAVQKGRGDAATPTGRPIIADETNSSSDFNQWLHAMKMVARLPGGMPPEFRRKLWLALADKYLKSKDIDWEKEEVKCFSEQWREDDEELGIQIVKDLHRTGSSLCSGPAGTINQAKLKRILLGYARFNPEVGYCQGFNMLGALILQVMDKEETESIKVMIYLVEGILPSGYFSGSLGGLQADMAVFRELMTSKLPRLAKHLQKLQGPVENAFEPPLTNVFTMQWFLTMFCTCLPMTCVLRVWDLVLIEGSDVLLRTALVLWSLLEERILSARTADDFYCQMGSFSSELLNGHLVDSNGLIEKVVDLGPIPDLQKLRDKHLYNITPFRDKKGLQLYYSDEDGDSDEESKMAVATAWGLRLRRGSAGLASKSSDGKDRIALDISLLKKQYDRLRERQRQAHIILTSAVARQGSSPNQASIQMNQLLMGRNAIVTNNGRRIGPPQGAIPPARKPSLPTSKPHKLAQTKKLLSGETLHWRDTDLSKRRRGSLKWKDIKSDSSQSGMEDRPAALVESAPSSRSSSSEAKSKRPSYKATRQRSDSSSYSEESDGNSSTSTSLCDEDDMPEHNNLSSLEGSPMRKSKSSKKHSEVTKQKSLEDVLNSNDGQPTVDNQIPFIQLTTIESPVLNANKTEIEPSLVENSETESNRLDYAGFVDEFSWPDINEQPTTSVSLEDTTTEAISEGDFLSLSNVITSTSQLSPMPDIATYINNSNISPLRTPISGFDYANLVVNIDSDPKKFDVNEEGVINEYFERVNVVERPTKLDLLYSLNEEDSIRKAYVSCEPTPESPKGVKEKPKIVEEEATQQRQASEEELDRKMKVLLEYSNKSSLSFIAEAKQEFSTGMFKEMEFDVDSLKYQPTKLVPIKRAHAVESPEIAENEPEMEPSLKVKNLAEELMEIELQSKAKEITQKEEVPEIKETKVSNIPSTEDLETRFRALEMNFSGRKESLKNEALVRKNSQRSIERDVDESRSSFVDSPSTNYSPQVKTSESLTKVNEGSGEADQRFRNSVGDIEGFSKRSSFVDSPPKHYSPQVETSECLTKVNEESCEADKRCSNSVGDVDGFSKRSSYVDSPSTHYSPQVETSENLTKVNEESGETVERPRYSVGDIDGFSKRYSFIDSPSKNYSPQVETLGSLTKVNEGSGGADQRCRNSVGDVDSFSKRSSFADSPSKHYSPQVETSECLTKVNEESGEAVQRSGNSVGELEDSHFKDLSTKKESSEYQTKDIEVLSEEIDISPKEDVVVTELSNTFTRKESTSLNRTIEEKHSPMTTETNVKEKDLSTDLKDREEEQIEDEHDTHALQTHRYSIEDRYQYSNIEHEKPLSPLMKEIPKSIENLNEDLKYDSQHYLKSEVENLMDKVETGNKQSEEIQGGASSQTESLKTEIREGAGSADENLSLEQDFMKIDTEETAILNDMNEKLHEKSSPLGQYEEVAKDPRIDRDINYSSCAAVEEQNLISQESKKPEYNDLEKQEEPLTTMKQVEEPSSSCRKSITDNPEAATLSETKSEQETDQVKTTNEKKVALDEPPEEPIVPCVASPTDDIPDSQFQSIIDETDTINLSDDRKQLLLPKDTKSKIKEILDEGVLFYEHYPAVPDGVEAGGVNDPNQSENASTQPNETQSREAESSQPQEKTPTSEDQLQPEKSIVPASSNRPDNTIVRKHDEPEPSFPTPKTIDKPQSTYSFSYTQNHFNDDVSVLSEVQGLQANQTANAIQSTFNLQHSPENLFAVTTSVSLGNSQTIRSSVSVKSSVSLKSSALYDRERSLQVNTGITVCDDPNEDSSKMISSNQLQLSGNQERSNYGAGITVSVINSEPSARTSNISLSMRLPEHSGDSLVGKTVRTDMLAQPKVLPQILDKNTSEKDKTDSDGNKADIRPADEPKTRKSSYSQEVEERLKALERRLSERVLTVSKDTKGADQPVAKEEPRQEQVLTLDDDQPMKLNVEKVSPTDSKQQKETKPGTGPEVEAMTDKEETNKVVPSTAELEHRFHELERKLSAKNIHLPAKIEQPQQEDKASSLTNPSIVLTKNEGAHGERELNDSKEQKKNEEPPSTPRRRIPSTEDLENRFEALEIQKSLKSPGNLLSPSKIKEEFPPEGAIDQETKRKTEIPSTEDLESRFQALEQSKKGDDVLKKSQSQENTTKAKDVPKVTFAESSDTKKVTQNCEEKPDLSRERVLRKVPSAKDLEARFEALEKRKSFTSFSSKTQEHLLAEQSRNYLSSESLNTVESLKRRELCEKKVASTEDLVLRLDALEQRMAITENSIKNKISSEKELSQKTANFECRFEALDNRQSFRENIASNKTPSTSRENLQNTFKPTKETLPETKLSMIKRSLFEPEPEPKRLPSTQDLENRFDALERQKSKSSLGVKANVTREPIKTESWETPFEQIEHRTPSPFGTKPLPRWDNDTTLSRFPSTRNLESRFEALEQQKFSTERRSNLTSTGFEVSKPSIQKTTLEKPAKAHASRSIDLVLEQISTKTEEIEREHQMLSKVPSTQDLEIRYNDLQLQTKRGNQKRRDLYKLESQSDETLTISHPTGTEFDTKSESRPTSCPEYRDPFDSNIVTTDRTLADSGGSRGDFNSTESRSGFTDSLLALGNIFPRTDESISPSRIRPQSPRVRSTITFRSDDSSITDRLASIKSTIKSIDTLCEDQSSRKDKCQRYIDSLFTSSPRSSNATSPIPIPTSHHLVASRPIIRIDDFEDGRRSPNPPAHYQERVAMREMKKEVSPRRRRDEEREEYESRVRRDTMMPNSVDDEAPSEISCSLENIANNKVDSEVDRINHKDKTQLERSISPYYAPGSDLHNRSTTPVVYVPTKLEIRHTTVTSTFYDRFLTEKHIERTFPRSKKHSPAVSPTITKSQLDISSSSGSTSLDRSSKSAENSPSRRKDSNSSGGGGGALSPNPTTTVSTAVAYKRGFLSSLEVAQKDLHIRSCDNILLQLRSSTLSNQQPMMPSITSMGYNPIPTKSTDLGISLGLYKDIHNGNDTTSSKS